MYPETIVDIITPTPRSVKKRARRLVGAILCLAPSNLVSVGSPLLSPGVPENVSSLSRVCDPASVARTEPLHHLSRGWARAAAGGVVRLLRRCSALLRLNGWPQNPRQKVIDQDAHGA